VNVQNSFGKNLLRTNFVASTVCPGHDAECRPIMMNHDVGQPHRRALSKLDFSIPENFSLLGIKGVEKKEVKHEPTWTRGTVVRRPQEPRGAVLHGSRGVQSAGLCICPQNRGAWNRGACGCGSRPFTRNSAALTVASPRGLQQCAQGSKHQGIWFPILDWYKLESDISGRSC